MFSPSALINPILCGVAAIALALSVAPAQAHDTDLDDHIRDYILRNPEIILEAMDILGQREHQDALDQALAPYRDVFTRPAQIGIGDRDGAIRVIEFFDYRCGPCKAIHPALKAHVAKYPDLRIEMRHLPILSPASDRAARFALAVQSLFGAHAHQNVHDALWAMKGPLSLPQIETIADDFGWDFADIQTVMDSDAITNQITYNKDMAIALGVLGTPAFIARNSVTMGRADLPALVKTWMSQSP